MEADLIGPGIRPEKQAAAVDAVPVDGGRAMVESDDVERQGRDTAPLVAQV